MGEKKKGGEGSGWSSSLSTLWNSVSLTEVCGGGGFISFCFFSL